MMNHRRPLFVLLLALLMLAGPLDCSAAAAAAPDHHTAQEDQQGLLSVGLSLPLLPLAHLTGTGDSASLIGSEAKSLQFQRDLMEVLRRQSDTLDAFPHLFQRPVIETQFGPVQGALHEKMAYFLGIPFAAPPTGPLRWKPPQAPEPWKEPLSTVFPGPGCHTGGIDVGKEDCLYLNVWAPRSVLERDSSTNGWRVKPHQKPLPVLFWIYGGGWVFGDGYQAGLYDAKDLMGAFPDEFIFVSHNYRLGPFGFLALDELRKETKERTSGNYALQDQQMALRWVRKNIAQFGGDPDSVTIFGESAGAFSVCWHLAAESSKGLFHRAIIQSGTCDSSDFFPAFSDASALSMAFAASVDCPRKRFDTEADFLQCLRKLSPEKVANAPLFNGSFPVVPPRRLAPLMPWGAAIDGSSAGLTATPLSMITARRSNTPPGTPFSVPVIAGVTRDEGSIFLLAAQQIIPGLGSPWKEGDLILAFRHFFPDISETMLNRLLQTYPVRPVPNPQEDRASRFLKDYVFLCPTRRLMNALQPRSSRSTSYMYQFSFVNEWIDRKLFGAYHSSELVYTFNHAFPRIPFLREFGAKDKQIAYLMNRYWLNFAEQGDPNSAQVPAWPAFESGAREVNAVFDLPQGQLEENLGITECHLLDSLPR